MSETVGSGTHTSRSSIVEQILEQGQRLRNAMVKSILDNDPLCTDLADKNSMHSYYLEKGKSVKSFAHSNLDTLSNLHPNSLLNYEWDDLSPPQSLIRPPTKSFDQVCHCKVCVAYRSQGLEARHHPLCNATKREAPSASTEGVRPFSGLTLSSYDSEDSQVPRNVPPKKTIRDFELETATFSSSDEKPKTNSSQNQNLSDTMTKSIQNSYRSKAAEFFKYVNSLKVAVHSLVLNQAGNRKVSVSSVGTKYRLPTSMSHSYFIEYAVPSVLVNVQPKTKSKVDSGLGGNSIRICSKKLHNEEVYFKHSSIFDVINLLQLDLKTVKIKFQVSSRTLKQKQSSVLGYATFNMSSFEVTKTLCCADDIPIVSDGLTLGVLKVIMQLGCGRMYFGKEFVDFVTNNSKNSDRSEVHSVICNTPVTSGRESYSVLPNKSFINKIDSENTVGNIARNDSKSFKNTFTESSEKPSIQYPSRQNSSRHNVKRPYDEDKKNLMESSADYSSDYQSNVIKENTNFANVQQNNNIPKIDNKTLLYGLIYVSEAQYFGESINSYLSCQVFCRGDTLCSRAVYDSKQPVFNFYQKVPFLYDDTFLICMRDNSITVQTWEREDDEDTIVGATQLSLHQFYLAYRNTSIAEKLIGNHLPVIVSDWWEPICSPVNGKLYGQMKVLVAVGTAVQINNLEVERGLKDQHHSVTYVPIVPSAGTTKKQTNDEQITFKRPEYLNKLTRDSKENVPTVKDNVSAVKEDIPEVKSISKAKKAKIDNVKAAKPEKSSKETSVTDLATSRIDIGVQSDSKMDSESERTASSSTNMLETFLAQLIEHQQRNKYVENSTNTENVDVHNNLNKSLNNEKPPPVTVGQSLDKLNQCKNATNLQIRKTSDLLDRLNEALNINIKPPVLTPASPPTPSVDLANFKAHVVVEGALHLPCKRKYKSRKTKNRKNAVDDSLPSTYVSFETVQAADLKISGVVYRSTNPQWDFRSDVLLPGEMLTNNQKRLIFKVWRKTNGASSQPNLQTDTIIGFAALDLTVLLAGLPSVQGWFNIVDFSSKCNGQIKIHITPLESLSRFTELNIRSVTDNNDSYSSFENKFVSKKKLMPEAQDEPTELLSRALKRKFSELEEITQRLRSRLADVTRDDSDLSNDELADEFERDINTLCVEEDYNMIDFEDDNWAHNRSPDEYNIGLLKEVMRNPSSLTNFVSSDFSIFSKGAESNGRKSGPADSAYGSHFSGTESLRRHPQNLTSSSSNDLSDTGSVLQVGSPQRSLTPADRQLIAGKQRIDTLLEKLTLLSGADSENAFGSRYVSGCSMHQEEVPVESKPIESTSDGFDIDAVLNSSLFNKICAYDSKSSTNLSETAGEQACAQSSSSSSSVYTQFSARRQAPDGAGLSVENNASTGKQNV